MQIIKVVGLASGRTREITFQNEELQENLMKWLRKNGVTVASSCDGEGVCKKCVIQNDWNSCELTLAELLRRGPDGTVIISYL